MDCGNSLYHLGMLMLQENFDKIHSEFLRLIFESDEETRNTCKPILMNLLLEYNRLSRTLGIEPNHQIQKSIIISGGEKE